MLTTRPSGDTLNLRGVSGGVGGEMSYHRPVRLKPPSVRVKDRRTILKAVPKLRKVKPGKHGK